MKNRFLLKIFGAMLAFAVLFASCEDDDPVTLDAQMDTWDASDISSTSAIIKGFVVAEGDGVSEHGIYWGLGEKPQTTGTQVVISDVDGAVFMTELTDLEHLTTYHYIAYVKDNAGNITFGEQMSFSTLPNIPTVSIEAVSDVVGKSAVSGGNVTYDGKADVVRKGICWSEHQAPTTEDNVIEGGKGLGTFESSIAGLEGKKTYFVRAFAINSAGTGYSELVTFTTPESTPTVQTDSVTTVTKTTAKAYGISTYSGGATITEFGFCWATEENPTVEGDHVGANGIETGVVFSADLKDLKPGTKYFVRAYAKNSVGVEYGDNIEIETVPDLFYLVGTLNGWDNHGLYTENRGAIRTSYHYLDNNSEFKILVNRDTWDGAIGQGETAGTIAAGGGNIVVADLPAYDGADFYEIKIDVENNTVALTKVAMGVIGSGQPGGWDADTDLTYNKETKKWEGTVTLGAEGEYKFRANDEWAINFGGELTNLVFNAGNMAVPGDAGDYNVVLDLSGVDAFSATVTPVK